MLLLPRELLGRARSAAARGKDTIAGNALCSAAGARIRARRASSARTSTRSVGAASGLLGPRAS